MAIPKFQDFLYPFLYQLKDKDMTTREMKVALIQHFNLTDEDCAIRTQAGSALMIDDRIGWVRQWLRRAMFIEIPQRGVYHITKRGVDYLKSHSDLRDKDLMQYPEYAEYAKGKTKLPKADENMSPKEDKPEELTPTEQLEQAYHNIVDDLASDLLQKTLDQSPYFFEHLVVDLLVKMGYGGSFANSAQVTKYVHDDCPLDEAWHCYGNTRERYRVVRLLRDVARVGAGERPPTP